MLSIFLPACPSYGTAAPPRGDRRREYRPSAGRKLGAFLFLRCSDSPFLFRAVPTVAWTRHDMIVDYSISRCRRLGGSSRPGRPLAWGDLVPEEFRAGPVPSGFFAHVAGIRLASRLLEMTYGLSGGCANIDLASIYGVTVEVRLNLGI